VDCLSSMLAKGSPFEANLLKQNLEASPLRQPHDANLLRQNLRANPLKQTFRSKTSASRAHEAHLFLSPYTLPFTGPFTGPNTKSRRGKPPTAVAVGGGVAPNGGEEDKTKQNKNLSSPPLAPRRGPAPPAELAVRGGAVAPAKPMPRKGRWLG